MEENYNQIHSMARSVRSVRFRIIAGIITVVVLFFVFLLVPLIFHGVKAMSISSSTWESAHLLLEQVNDRQWEAGVETTRSIGDDLDSLSVELGKLGPITWIPGIKEDIKVVREFLTVANSLTSAYSETFVLFSQLEKEGFEINLFDILASKEALLSVATRQDQLNVIEQSISQVRADFEGINVKNFSGFFNDELLEVHTWLGQLVYSTDIAIPVITHLTDLLGFKEEKNYLVIFQNNMELRPTGGFIGSYGVLTIKNGEIKNLFTDDIYNLDKLSEGKMKRLAPEQMLTYNNQQYWYMRDANWYPNWPDSARNIVDFFFEERRHAGLLEQKLDGVIAITPDFISNILEVVGPIQSQGVTFKAENFAMDLEQFVEFDYVQHGIPATQRKAIIGVLSQMLVEKVEENIEDKIIDLWLAFKSNIDQKNILVYVFNEDLQKYFSDKNWAGEIRQTDGDYLMVVDSNFASLKTDSVIERSINYRVDLNDDGELIARMEMTYKHTGSFVRDLITRYRTYAKVYVPAESWFERGWIREGGVDMPLDMAKNLEYGKEYDKSYAAYFVVVEPGETKTVILEYKLPESVKKQYQNGYYNLLIQKQPGTPGNDLEIDLNFDKIISAYNSSILPLDFGGKSISWKDDLSVDRVYKIKFEL